jgi:Dirigent-like protein
MKHLVKVSLALAAAAAVAVPLALAGSTGAGRNFEFVSVQQRFTSVPHASRQSPPRVGLRLVFQDLAYNRGEQFGRPAGAVIGRAEGVCTVIAISKRPQAQCLITAHVPDGQIVLAGEGDPGAKVSRYAIVGGLGAYANARGWITATTLSETKTLIAAHLDS